FIVCVSEKGGQYGIAACDLSTGEFYATAVECSMPLLGDEVFAFSPAEIIGDHHLLSPLRDLLKQWNRQAMMSDWTNDGVVLPEAVRVVNEQGNELTEDVPSAALYCVKLLYI